MSELESEWPMSPCLLYNESGGSFLDTKLTGGLFLCFNRLT